MYVRIVGYLLTLLVYLPGLIYGVRTRKFLEYPLLAFVFLGMLIFNAVGSIFIAFPQLYDRDDYFTWSFLGILNGQALLFYLFTGAYLGLVARRTRRLPAPPKPVSDLVFLHAVLGLICFILVLYVNDAGMPPLVELIRGNLDNTNIIGYRTQATIDLDRYYLYNLAFGPLPMIVAVQALTLHLAYRLPTLYTYAIILLSVLFTSLPGGKASALDTFVALMITYVLVRWGYLGFGRSRIQGKWLAASAAVAMVPVLLMYKVYLGSGTSLRAILSQFVYRVVGVYSETMAASVVYADVRGFLEGASFPTIRGLLNHDAISLSAEMHTFLFGIPGGAPVPFSAEGFINFGWVGFLAMCVFGFVVAIVLQETLRRVRMDAFWLSILVFFIIAGSKVAVTSIFGTLISLTYGVAIGVLLIIRRVLSLASLPALSRTPGAITPPAQHEGRATL